MATFIKLLERCTSAFPFLSCVLSIVGLLLKLSDISLLFFSETLLRSGYTKTHLVEPSTPEYYAITVDSFHVMVQKLKYLSFSGLKPCSEVQKFSVCYPLI